MGHKCFISFKAEDSEYKRKIQEDLKIDMIDNSLDEAINSENEEYILQTIRKNHLSDSTVTIHLIGSYSFENMGKHEQRYIKRELQASLYNGPNNSRSGILGVVLPSATNKIYQGSYTCSCGVMCSSVVIDETTVVDEFSRNYYIGKEGKCHWSEDERYCVLVTWENFEKEPNKFIDMAFDKRKSSIANKVTVYPK